jgi:DNA-binding NtrC family response regulator
MKWSRVTNRISRVTAQNNCRLKVVDGPDAGKEFSIPDIGVKVGAASSSDIVLNDESVSGQHFSVVPSADGFVITDLDSKNGTYLDGVVIDKATVPAGGQIRVGTSCIQLIPSEESIDLPPSQADHFGDMIGASLAMRCLFALLERAASADASLLLIGESGTGKELAARAIHANSQRSQGPFIVFDCGAASETIIESELFGHVKGAFTGAERDRPGAFACADQGTLFLDEIGDLPLRIQPKLLRLLESGEVTPLGSNLTKQHDVRIVAATHKNLWAEANAGEFRFDLYYRLAVMEFFLPPLRQRREDIPDLVDRFLKDNKSRISCSEGETLNRLMSYNWPGNVRELRNVITRAVVLGSQETDFSRLPITLRAAEERDQIQDVDWQKPYRQAKADLLGWFDKTYLSHLMSRSNNNVSQAARLAGVERKYLYRLLKKSKLRK